MLTPINCLTVRKDSQNSLIQYFCLKVGAHFRKRGDQVEGTREHVEKRKAGAQKNLSAQAVEPSVRDASAATAMPRSEGCRQLCNQFWSLLEFSAEAWR